jgi:hypothetical protein
MSTSETKTNTKDVSSETTTETLAIEQIREKNSVSLLDPANVVIIETPSRKDQLYHWVSSSLNTLWYWKDTFKEPIQVTHTLSPVRFTTGISPVTLELKGIGYCIYSLKFKWFHNGNIRLTVPINKSTSILFIGWGQVFKYSLHPISSIQDIKPFSVVSDPNYAHATIPKQNTSLPTIRTNLVDISINTPKIPTVQINRVLHDQIRHTLKEMP